MTNSSAEVREHLEACIADLENAFQPDELAYLALTSKVELPVRDRLAWGMHARLGSEFVVAREWRRADLAILRGEEAFAQVEAKAFYAFDVLKETASWVGKMERDGQKMQRLAPDAQAFLLALVTNIEGSIQPHLRRHVVKYSAGIIKAAEQAAKGTEAVADLARARWTSDARALGEPVSLFAIQGGSCWGLEVSVDAYLVGPIA